MFNLIWNHENREPSKPLSAHCRTVWQTKVDELLSRMSARKHYCFGTACPVSESTSLAESLCAGESTPWQLVQSRSGHHGTAAGNRFKQAGKGEVSTSYAWTFDGWRQSWERERVITRLDTQTDEWRWRKGKGIIASAVNNLPSTTNFCELSCGPCHTTLILGSFLWIVYDVRMPWKNATHIMRKQFFPPLL